ncbi:hypothetical protein FRAHR75_40043 [Frankia sp. Hr75.2]|nr:hypothetical protein FRAHR75_40043 [Frankia sp. Hr75.2]
MFQLRPAGVSPDIPPAADHVLSQPRFPHQHEIGTLRRPGSSAAKTRRRQDRMTRPHGADPAVRAGAGARIAPTIRAAREAVRTQAASRRRSPDAGGRVLIRDPPDDRTNPPTAKSPRRVIRRRLC